MKSNLFLLLFGCGLMLMALPHRLSAQERCGTVEYEKMIHPGSSRSETENQFEQWMKARMLSKQTSDNVTLRTQAGPYKIPVVIHIIHKGEGIGSGVNISDAQVLSQIQVLNDDFKRMNSDAVNTPAEFLPFAGSIDIEFILAAQDPDGASTTGITRTTGTRSTWELANNNELKSLSYWPAENYLNIWVTDLSNSSGLIGYAQLPLSSQVSGLENSSQDRLTDGVVIDYLSFGKGSQFNLRSQYNLGRSATHEVGHFFGLRHVWGDGSCATDYVDDTPFQAGETMNCPANPQASCDVPARPNKMFQDYMDYTDDACMNLFTKNQDDRMDIVINNSPRRASLLTSIGATAPTPVANDLGIRQIISPTGTSCLNPLTPQIEIRNYGSNNITSCQIVMTVNGTPQSPVSPSISLAPSQSTTVSFTALPFAPGSSQLISFQIIQTNGGTDGRTGNNTASIQVNVPTKVALPILEPFNSIPAGWSIINPDGLITWANITAPDLSPTNKAMYMNFYDYEDEGTSDWLVTPSFSTTVPVNTQLRFDLAYAQFPGETGDNLKVYALPGCTTDLSAGILLYNKSDIELVTAASTQSPFIPSSNSQWRKSEVLSLSALTPGTNWQIAFVGSSGWGNNLFIDNVNINDQLITDLAITTITSPALVSCELAPLIQFVVKNLSTTSVTKFKVQATLNGIALPVTTFQGISIAIGEEKSFQITLGTLNTGPNEIILTITEANGLPDGVPSNNTITYRTYVDRSTDLVPLRKTFDVASETPWVVATPANSQSWTSVTTNKKQSVVHKGFSITDPQQESWLVSPVLDFSKTPKASLFFDVSYARRGSAVERLRVLASANCGVTYDVVLFDQVGTDFSPFTSTAEWIPTTDSQWSNQYIDLASITGKKNVRLAFIVSNRNGNNLYLDNIEIYNDGDTQPIRLPQTYQLYYSTRNSNSDIALSFNLPDRKNVRLQVYSMVGQIVIDNVLPNTLNQTYYFDLGLQSQGIYIFRLQIDEQVTATKVFIGH
ncbi:hypothetical protein BH09BAC3_BH09BAC3_21180 [soil metagenome]